MLRIHPIADAKEAASYYSKSDGGYYLGSRDLHCEWGGKGAEMLGLHGRPDYKHFENLIHGLHPQTGEQLTAKLIDNRIPGWDLTTSVPKGVTTALECGDSRIQAALWDAARETMAEVEAMTTTRIRAGGKQEDRVTGNLVWYAVEHPETRPAKEDKMPDWDRHIHFVCMNLTFDEAEQQWKAVKFRPVMDVRKWFDRRFDSRVASKLADLGYEIETKWKADERGGRKYFSWDIKGIPDSVITTFSRRAREVKDLADELGVRSAVGKDKLGATSREFKRKDMTLEDYRAYWNGRVTEQEGREIAESIKRALTGQNPRPEPQADKAVAYSLSHHFERHSVVPVEQVEITAMERSMGSALPEEVTAAAKAQGLLVKDGEATTRQVLEQEGRIIAFAREGRGTMRPLLGARPQASILAGSLAASHDLPRTIASTVTDAVGNPKGLTPKGSEQPNIARFFPEQQAKKAYHELGVKLLEVADAMKPFVLDKDGSRPTDYQSKNHFRDLTQKTDLSAEQQAVCRHVWESPDRVIMVEGDAGVGKTHTMKAAVAGIDKPVVILAPSSDASRNVLRRDFPEADTVASFLGNRQFQARARDGVIWVDEAGQLSMKQLDQLFGTAEQLGARVILQGDRKQHASVERGHILNVLEEHAGLPVARLTEIRRQTHKEYRQAVSSIAKGDILRGYDILVGLGWVKEGGLVDDYLAALDSGKTALVVAPTHAEGDEITAEIRDRLKAKGVLGDERVFEVLKPVHWTEAQKGDRDSYDGTELLQFHRNSGAFRAGQRVGADVLRASEGELPSHQFSAYTVGNIKLAAGDIIRITGNGWTADKKHRLNNGTLYTVEGFTKPSGKNPGGDIELSNGWVIPKGFGFLSHGYVTTSHASQGKTVDRILIAMGKESSPAINAEQFYVSASRGRERATIYSDLPAAELREAIQRSQVHKSATELMGVVMPRAPSRQHGYGFVRRVQSVYRQLREKARGFIQEWTRHREIEHVR